MPTYQYQCTECGAGLEVVQSFTDDNLTECPECSGRLRKVFNAVGVVFKGSGFYRNDSRPASSSSDTPKSESSKNGAKKDSSSEGSKKKESTNGSSGSSSSGSSSSTTPASTGG